MVEVVTLVAKWKSVSFHVFIEPDDKSVICYTDLAKPSGCLSFYNTNLLLKMNRTNTFVQCNDGLWVTVWQYLKTFYPDHSKKSHIVDLFLDELPFHPPALVQWALVVKKDGSRAAGRVKGTVVSITHEEADVLWLNDHYLETMRIDSIVCIDAQPVRPSLRRLFTFPVSSFPYSIDVATVMLRVYPPRP